MYVVVLQGIRCKQKGKQKQFIAFIAFMPKFEGMGRRKKIESPEKLWEYYQGYLETLKSDRVFEEKDWVGKDAKEVVRNKYPPPTWAGLEAYIFRLKPEFNNQGYVNLDAYKANEGGLYGDYQIVLRAIKVDMYDRKVGGAAVGVFQHHIIAKELGIGEKVEITTHARPILEGGKPLPQEDEDGLPSNDEILGV